MAGESCTWANVWNSREKGAGPALGIHLTAVKGKREKQGKEAEWGRDLRVTGRKGGESGDGLQQQKDRAPKTGWSTQILTPHSGTSASGVFLFLNSLCLHILNHQLEAQLGTCKPLKKQLGYLAGKRSSQHELQGCYEPCFTSDFFPSLNTKGTDFSENTKYVENKARLSGPLRRTAHTERSHSHHFFLTVYY